MNLTFDGGTDQQRAWVQEAINSDAFPLDALPVNITVTWADPTPCGAAHSYMCTSTSDDINFTITIEPWADDPTNPNLSGLPDPAADIKTFYMQSFVHELGHVAHYALVSTDDLRTQVCALFYKTDVNAGSGVRYGTLADWSTDQTPGLTWGDQIKEAVAECIKCAFYQQRLIFMNRTNWRIDASKWEAFLALISPSRPQFIFWTNLVSDPPAIGRATIDGGDPNPEFLTFSGDPDTQGLAADGQYVYFISEPFPHGDTFLARARVDGTDIVAPLISPILPAAQLLVVRDPYIVWSDGAYLGRARTDGSDVDNNFIHVPGESLADIALAGDYVYWTQFSPNAYTVGRANIVTGGEIDQAFFTLDTSATLIFDAANHIASDGRFLYFTGADLSGFPIVFRTGLDGSSPTILFRMLHNPLFLAEAGGFLCWGYFLFDEAIGRANTDGSDLLDPLLTSAQITLPEWLGAWVTFGAMGGFAAAEAPYPFASRYGNIEAGPGATASISVG